MRPTIGLPWSSSGTTGSGGARRRLPMSPISSGASATKSRRNRSTCGASSIGQASRPASTVGPSGCSWNSNEVTIPKLPPPPRRPQNSSGFSRSLATTNSPSAVTTSHDRRLSIVRPNFRMMLPMPPPRVSPATPVWLTIPPVTASPNAWLSRSTCELRQPPSTRIVPASGSTRDPVMSDRSITMPSSQSAWPAMACPPPRTAVSRSCSRAKRTAAITSATPRHRAMSAGRRSMWPFQILRVSSYVGSSGRTSSPRKPASSASSVAVSSAVIPASLGLGQESQVADLQVEHVRELRPRLGAALRQVGGREQTLVRLITLQHLPGDRHLVHLGRPVGDAHDRRRQPHAGERHLVRHAERTVDVHRAVHDVVHHLRRRHLDAGDLGAGLVPADLVDRPRRLQHLEPELEQLDPRLGDRVLDHLLLRQHLTLGLPAQRPLAHHVERPLARPDGPHGVVDAAPAQPRLRDHERLPLAAEQVLGRHPHVLVPDVRVRALAFALSPEADVADDIDTRCVGRQQEHRRALVDGDVRIRDGHHDRELGVPQVRREPLLAVDYPLVAVALGTASELLRVGPRLRFGHRVTGRDAAVEERLEVLLLLLVGAVVGDDLRVPRVGRL